MTDYFKPHERDILFRRFEELTPEMRSTDNRIDAHQMLCHLNNSLREICGLQPVESQSNLFKRTIGKWLVFHLTPWPERNPATPEALVAFVGTKPPTSFAADHAEFVSLLQTFDEQCARGTIGPHPHFGYLSRAEWGQYMFLHIDYHLTTFGIHGDFRAPA